MEEGGSAHSASHVITSPCESLPVQGWSLPASPGLLSPAICRLHWSRRSFLLVAVAPVLCGVS